MAHSRTSLFTIALLCASLAAPFAYAASVKLCARDEPALIDEGLTASVTAKLTGLGEGHLLVTLKATGAATPACPARPSELTFVTHQVIDAAAIVDGAVVFTVRTDPPLAAAPGCPAQRLADVEFVDAFLEVHQPPDAREPLFKAYCDLGGCTPIDA